MDPYTGQGLSITGATRRAGGLKLLERRSACYGMRSALMGIASQSLVQPVQLPHLRAEDSITLGMWLFALSLRNRYDAALSVGCKWFPGAMPAVQHLKQSWRD